LVSRAEESITIRFDDSAVEPTPIPGVDCRERCQQVIDVALAPLVDDIYVERGDWRPLSHRGEAANEDELDTMVRKMAEQAFQITVTF
jgi:hypothetical protein